MLFDSFTFAAFFGLVLCLHRIPIPWSVKKFNLLVASYVFYGAWNPPFIGLLFLSTVIDWTAAGRIAKTHNSVVRRVWLSVSVCTNLGLLCFFKYGAFVLENISPLLGIAGVDYQSPSVSIILPWGISFYTFQSMSYTIDVYRGHMKPWKSFQDVALYIAFFPQLLAGPIVRSGAFLPQCVRERAVSTRKLAWGLSLVTFGLFLKVVVADTLLAPIVDRVYDESARPDTLSAWCGALAFPGQVYGDFCGYAACAVGLALCLGFSLPDNFHCPYAAYGLADFWKRWHITLYSWFRDYVYISIGGNRKGSLRTCVNIVIVLAISGLWHGASWTYVVFGFLHGILLVIEIAIKRSRLAMLSLWKTLFGRILIVGITFSTLAITEVLFRANSFAQAGQILKTMFGIGPGGRNVRLDSFDIFVTSVVLQVVLVSHFILRDTKLETLVDRYPWWARSLVLAGMISAILMAPGDDRAFIYFEF